MLDRSRLHKFMSIWITFPSKLFAPIHQPCTYWIHDKPSTVQSVGSHLVWCMEQTWTDRLDKALHCQKSESILSCSVILFISIHFCPFKTHLCLKVSFNIFKPTGRYSRNFKFFHFPISGHNYTKPAFHSCSSSNVVALLINGFCTALV